MGIKKYKWVQKRTQEKVLPKRELFMIGKKITFFDRNDSLKGISKPPFKTIRFILKKCVK